MFAVVQAGGQQFKVSPGDRIRTALQAQIKPKALIQLEVLAVQGEGGREIAAAGLDDLKKAFVKARVVQHGLAKKIIVFKKKRRTGYRRTKGFRQGWTELQITEITLPSGKALIYKPPQNKKLKRLDHPTSKKSSPTKSAAPGLKNTPEGAKAAFNQSQTGAAKEQTGGKGATNASSDRSQTEKSAKTDKSLTAADQSDIKNPAAPARQEADKAQIPEKKSLSAKKNLRHKADFRKEDTSQAGKPALKKRKQNPASAAGVETEKTKKSASANKPKKAEGAASKNTANKPKKQ